MYLLKVSIKATINHILMFRYNGHYLCDANIHLSKIHNLSAMQRCSVFSPADVASPRKQKQAASKV